MNILQIALLSNGIFSLSTGIYLIIFKNKVAHWFGQEGSLVFLIIGIGLLYFSYTIFKEIKNPNSKAVFYIITQDFLWVIASVAILTIKPFSISALGSEIIIGIALVVLFFSIGQAIGLAQVDSIKENGVKRMSFDRIVNATKEETWMIISDVSNYHKVAPNIDTVEIISGNGKGLVRSCRHGKESWSETCTLWEVENQYSFLVNTEAEDYPFPLQYLKGTWKINEISNNQTKITMIFDLKYNHKVYSILIHPFLKSKFKKVCSELLDNWEKEIELK